MDDNRFYKLVKFIDKLDFKYKERLYAILQEQVDPNNLDQQEVINELRETRFNKGLICPHCSGEEIVRYGKYKGRQRHKCKCCEKTINKFKGISSKYLDNYLSWYNFLDSIGHENTINNIKKFLVKICLYQYVCIKLMTHMIPSELLNSVRFRLKLLSFHVKMETNGLLRIKYFYVPFNRAYNFKIY